MTEQQQPPPLTGAARDALLADETMWTVDDVARELDVARNTVLAWRMNAIRRELDGAGPVPDHDALAVPNTAGAVRRWALQCGRLDSNLRPRKVKPGGPLDTDNRLARSLRPPRRPR